MTTPALTELLYRIAAPLSFALSTFVSCHTNATPKVGVVVIGWCLLVFCAGRRFGVVVHCASWMLLSAVADEPQVVGVVGGSVLAVESLRSNQLPGGCTPSFSVLVFRLAQASLCMQGKSWPQRLSLALTIASIHLGCSSLLSSGSVTVRLQTVSTQTDGLIHSGEGSSTQGQAAGTTATSISSAAAVPACAAVCPAPSTVETHLLDSVKTPVNGSSDSPCSVWFEVQQKSQECWQSSSWMDEKMKPCTQPPPGSVPGPWQHAVALFRKDRYWTQFAGGKSVRRRRWERAK
mmetsp:Transcript_25041/g.55062  ORF Transcript_25041/g.55062 Transcript_25041/m.55062 type:complete len:291 (-) Transcript_25041:17-889(-)